MINLNKKDVVADSIKSVLENSVKKQNTEVVEAIDPEVRTKDVISGRKPTKQKDDVGPGSDGKSTKVKLKSESTEITKPKATLRQFKEVNNTHSIYDQMISEILSKDASAGDYIHDFVHSDDPRFEGKSKEKRKQMALAAYYAKEEVETDICPECMEEPCVCGGNHVSEELKGKQHKIDKNKNNKIDGQDFAILRGQKKVKEEAELEEGIENRSQQAWARKLRGKPAPEGTYAARKPSKPTKPQPTKEEVEQIDELDKKTYGSYIKSATKDASAARSLSKDFEIAAKRAKSEKMKIANAHLSKRFQNAAIKRHAGISKAVDRLTKEEVEQVEEGWDDMLKDVKAKRGPQPSGGSGVKQGSRYGGSKQKDKPEQDTDKKVNESKRPETDNVPFAPPYNTSSNAVTTDKSGSKHTPMSRVKHMAYQAMQKIKKDVSGKNDTSK